MTAIMIINGALDEDARTGEIVLRGTIASMSLGELEVADYQREVLSPTKIQELTKALRGNGVPDIVLGMRGENYEEQKNGVFVLNFPTFIVDGLQRVTAAKQLLADDTDVEPHLGVKVYFGTDAKSERRLFIELNAHQTKVNGNVMLRNLAEEHTSIRQLIKMCESPTFVLTRRVSWTQNMKRGDLITAVMLTKVAGMLHSHVGSGRSANVHDLSVGLDRIMESVGSRTFIDNVKTFYDTLDKAWTVRDVAFKGSTHLKSTFMLTLARLLSDHECFWDGNHLSIDNQTLKRLALFQTHDPQIMNLAGSGSTGGKILYELLVDHINHKRRTNRLKSRRLNEMDVLDMEEEA